MHTRTELELDSGTIRQMVGEVLEQLGPVLDTLADAPADSGPPAHIPAPRPLPEHRMSFDAVLTDFVQRLGAGVNPASGGFMGYIPGGGLPHAAVCDLMADIVNRYVGVTFQVPQLTAIESEAISWLAALAGYPSTSAGTFTSGGSAANLIGLAAAREDRFPDGDDASDPRTGVVYVSDQAHHSVLKAARILGIRSSQVRVISTDAAFRMHVPALEAAIRDDRAAGRAPFVIVASAGTTNTGAVDPLSELADIAERENLWLHVDAAYGGLFGMTERGAARMRGIERADTLVLDPHKTLFLPYGTGALLARDGRRVARAFHMPAAYLPTLSDDAPPQPSDLSFELTRPFRGLRVWVPLLMHGVQPFREQLDEKMDLAHSLCESLRAFDDVEVIAEPQLSTFAFAMRAAAGESMEQANQRTAALLAAVNADGRVLVTGTTLRGRFVVRPSIVSFRTHGAHVETLRDGIVRFVEGQVPA